MLSIQEALGGNSYPGRGILIGRNEEGNGTYVVYFIMGRSENSRNRIFSKTEDGIRTEAFDPSKMVDPSLIIYHPVRSYEGELVVTNGDQTDTIYDGLAAGKSFYEALESRCFEPDAPNFTPRISAEAVFGDGTFRYRMSILKSADAEGSACNRFGYDYAPVAGVGHFIHTYEHDGNPLPTFQGEPERVEIPDCIDAFTDEIWNALDDDNKISLYVRYTDIESGAAETRMLNKHQ